VPALTLVAGAGQGQFRIGEAEGVGGTGVHQGEGLDGLEGRPGQDRSVGLSPRPDEAARGVHDDGVHLVPAFDPVAPGDLDDEGRVHVGLTREGTPWVRPSQHRRRGVHGSGRGAGRRPGWPSSRTGRAPKRGRLPLPRPGSGSWKPPERIGSVGPRSGPRLPGAS